ncbi:MAG: hypothetical protein ACYDBT_10005 [Desulfobulbaceae bacterium]
MQGDVYLQHQHVFGSGKSKPKYLILISTQSQPDDPVGFVLTTSQQNDKPTIKGCHKERALFFLPVGTCACFNKPTWILLSSHEFTIPETISKNGGCLFKETLPANLTKAIIDCLMDSVGEDIPLMYKDLIRSPIQTGLQQLASKFKKNH